MFSIPTQPATTIRFVLPGINVKHAMCTLLRTYYITTLYISAKNIPKCLADNCVTHTALSVSLSPFCES